MKSIFKKISGYNTLKKILPAEFTINRRHLHFQSFYKSLCDCLADDPLVKMKDFHGIFAMDARSDLFKRILFYREYESHLAQCCLDHLDNKGDVVDVGANVGFFSVLFAKHTRGKVLSVEPSPNVLPRLYRNIKINNVENISVYEGVALDQCGFVDINIVEGKDEYSSVGNVIHSSAVGMQILSKKVEATTLNKLVVDYNIKPKLIKIDAEGAEHLVFSGSNEVLESFRPIIVSEIAEDLLQNLGSSSIELIDVIKKNGYKVYDVLNPTQEIDRMANGNILCKPN
ncbi:MAG: FkbM family methyltransferase [Desulfuromonadales bacterium]